MFGEGLKVKVNTVLLKLECVHGLNCPGHLVNNAGSGWAGLLDGATAAGEFCYAVYPRSAKNEYAASAHLQPAQPCFLFGVGKAP